jgi:hypothetical protein
VSSLLFWVWFGEADPDTERPDSAYESGVINSEGLAVIAFWPPQNTSFVDHSGRRVASPRTLG